MPFCINDYAQARLYFLTLLGIERGAGQIVNVAMFLTPGALVIPVLGILGSTPIHVL